MRLHEIKINGYKRLKDVSVLCGDATFLIGPNNAGKSSVLKAIEYLLSAKKQISSDEYYSIADIETGETKVVDNTITIEGEFRNLPEESKQWRGFKGRIFEYEVENETGLSVFYKKSYELGKDVVIQFKSKKRERKEEFVNCKKIEDYVTQGISLEKMEELFPGKALGANLGVSKPVVAKFEELDDIWNLLEEEEWFTNPGGIPGNVLKMLPRFLLIPAETSISEINGSSGVLNKTLNELFEDVREGSANYEKAQEYLDKLAKELNPSDKDSEFGKMMLELNDVLAGVFPDTQLHASTDLSDPSKAIKPIFDVEMSSNVKTTVDHQGSGMIRAAAFGMLRFRQKWLSRREGEDDRSIIICFEEPEIYLHPSAANQMRDTIYELSTSNSQIVATTHSPFIIDISRKPSQVLNSMKATDEGIDMKPFSVSDEYKKLEGVDKDHVKMLLKIDDYISRVFFTEKVIVVEGDTDDIALKESIKKLPKDQYLKIVSSCEIVKARGKATIISFVKYLKALGIEPIVVHDRDRGTAGAEVFNQPIKDALGGVGKLVLMEENIEDEIGYKAPSSDKPFKAFKEISNYSDWDSLPAGWKNKLKEIFGDLI
ncbi:MAG: AAA family ATPase [Fibrobacterales bacterium]